jgi:hypothetical protein
VKPVIWTKGKCFAISPVGGAGFLSLATAPGIPVSLPIATFIKQFGQRPCGASAASGAPNSLQICFASITFAISLSTRYRRKTRRRLQEIPLYVTGKE